MYFFKEKDCPFCDGYTDDRDNTFQKSCNHSFTKTEYNAALCNIADMKKLLEENRKIVRKMKKIIDK